MATKYSAKQRAGIYLKALMMLEGDWTNLTERWLSWQTDESGICELLYTASQKEWDQKFCSKDIDIKLLFPEFSLFEPETCEDAYFWWCRRDRESRKNALALMIAMANHP